MGSLGADPAKTLDDTAPLTTLEPRSSGQYRARLAGKSPVYDGDTFHVDIELGLNVVLQGQTIRLLIADAPELKGATKEAGIKARDILRELLKGEIIVECHNQHDAFRRWLCHVYVRAPDGKLISIGPWMVNNGFARIWAKKS